MNQASEDEHHELTFASECGYITSDESSDESEDDLDDNMYGISRKFSKSFVTSVTP
jgi:hypothetical protein